MGKKKKRREALRGQCESELDQRWRAANDILAVAELNMDAEILSVNRRFLKCHGYVDEKELVGRSYALLAGKDIFASHEYQLMWGGLHRGIPLSGRFKHRTRQGGRIWMRGVLNPVFDPQGVPVRVHMLGWDITREVELEEVSRDLHSEVCKGLDNLCGKAAISEESLAELQTRLAQLRERDSGFEKSLRELLKQLYGCASTASLLAVNADLKAIKNAAGPEDMELLALEARDLASKAGRASEIVENVRLALSESGSSGLGECLGKLLEEISTLRESARELLARWSRDDRDDSR